MDDLTRTTRWVAPRGAAGRAATGFMRLTLRRARWWAFVLVVELLGAVVVGAAIDERHGLPARAVWGLLYAVVPTIVIATLALLLSHVLNRRLFGRRLGEGTVLEASVGSRALLLRGPWAETTLSFEALEWVRTDGRWVFLKQLASPVVGVWPAELFDTTDLERLDRAVRSRDAAASVHTGRASGVQGS